MRRLVLAASVAILCGSGCSGEDSSTPGPSGTGTRTTAEGGFGAPPAVPDEPLESDVDAALGELTQATRTGVVDGDALATVAASDDARLAWLVSDVLRFAATAEDEAALLAAFEELTGTEVASGPNLQKSSWQSLTDHLIAWDLPAPPGYRERKRELFVAVEPGWAPFFDDADSGIDWRLVSWGGVSIDDRPEGARGGCTHGCIPALDDPELTDAAGGEWYPDNRIVFGVVVGAEAVAFPKNVMEVHEMVNITIGGRRIGMPYCTLCGSAQAYFLDEVPDGAEPVLRTSGLLSRSNKVMYDLHTRSVFDTFTGRALSGPLRKAGVTLPQTTVVASPWGEWKRAHPRTRIVAQSDDGAYPLDPLGGRDDNGPIFPIGDADGRLPVQEEVVGVIAPDGQAIAFPVADALATVADGERVIAAGVELRADGGGLRASTASGRELPSHQAFWFAWSQFNPQTRVWTRG